MTDLNSHLKDWQIVQICCDDKYWYLWYKDEDEAVEEEVEKAEKITHEVLSQREIDDLLGPNDDHKYIISVYEDNEEQQKTFFLKNMKFDDNGKLYEYDFCYNVNDADKIGLYKTAVEIKKEVVSSYRSTACLNIQTRQVNILDIAD